MGWLRWIKRLFWATPSYRGPRSIPEQVEQLLKSLKCSHEYSFSKQLWVRSRGGFELRNEKVCKKCDNRRTE